MSTDPWGTPEAIAEFHELLPACEVRAQPAGSTAVNAKLAFDCRLNY